MNVPVSPDSPPPEERAVPVLVGSRIGRRFRYYHTGFADS
jgi:hypothetical protein